MEFLQTLTPMQASIVCTLFTWGVTALGSALVFFFKTCKDSVMHTMLGLGAGVMIAACFWSLLTPAMEMSEAMGRSSWITPSVGLLLGGAFIVLADRLLDVCHKGESFARHKRSILLVTAVTLHNIPEGMVVGVAFASAALEGSGTSFLGAAALALGIGLQNFPEGAAVSLPLRSAGASRSRSFFYGQLSGVVEPLAAIAGVLAVGVMQGMVPFLMAFSAGTMIAVVVGELIPESAGNNKYYAIGGFIVGFVLMMILDVTLG